MTEREKTEGERERKKGDRTKDKCVLLPPTMDLRELPSASYLLLLLLSFSS